MKDKRISAFAAIVVAVLLTLTGASALAQPATLTVQGTGMVAVEADRASISIGVEENARSVRSAMAGVNERMACVVDALLEMGVDEADIATDAVSVYANYDYETDQRLLGYTASNILTVMVADADDAGAVVDAAVAAGANRLNSIDFFAADTSEAQKQALALAVERAREKAELLAGAAGLTLGEILEIREGDGSLEDPVLYARAEDAGAATQLYSGKQHVFATVTVIYALGDAG